MRARAPLRAACVLAASTVGARALALALLLALAQTAAAQQTGRAGDFDYYVLVLSWSPTYCAGQGQGRSDPQCTASRPYAFVLHGLWPQYQRGWPESCRTAANPFVPRPIIDGMLDIMPSPRLVIHEYRKHGTCSGLDPKGYFELARRLYQQVRIPPRFDSPERPIATSPAEIVREFLAANPALKPEMLAIACGRPNRVREVRVCFSRGGELTACGRNEEQDRLCRTQNVVLPPAREVEQAPGRRRGLPPE